MSENKLSVREINEIDIELITNYWLSSNSDFLIKMGVDVSKMPDSNEWKNILTEQLSQPYSYKKSYCLIWELNGKAIGHCNINKIIFEQEAFMHLHIWYTEHRNKGMGSHFLKLTIPYFFKNIKIKKLYSEPYSMNKAPNKTLEKIGFKLVKSYITIPGYLNFEQPVNLWELNL